MKGRRGKMRQAKRKQQQRQAMARRVMARRVMIEQLRHKWLEKPVLFTIPQGIGYGVVYLISDDGDVIVSHAEYQQTGLPPAFAFNVERIDEFLTIVL
jgi:hypothetical protein